MVQGLSVRVWSWGSKGSELRVTILGLGVKVEKANVRSNSGFGVTCLFGI